MPELVDLIAQRGLLGRSRVHTPPSGIGDGHVFAYGVDGDLNLGRAMADVEIANTGTRDLYAAFGLKSAVAGDDYRRLIPAGKSRFLAGVVEQLVLYNTSGSGGAALAEVAYTELPVLNSAHPNGHPGHGSSIFRIANSPNAAVVKTREIQIPITVTGVVVWAKSKRTSAGGAYTLAIAGAGNNILSAATYDLEGITNAVLASVGLSATPAHLNLDPGDDLVVTVTSDNADLTAGGDLMIEVLWTPR